jgi:hypothetical protein
MEPDKIATETITQVVAEVATALRDAAVEYGPEAADLALLAFRIDAIRTLVEGGAWVVILIVAWRLWMAFFVKSEDWDDDTKYPTRIIIGIVGGFAGTFIGAFAINTLINIPLWVAAFGAPELLIATRALEAAGLM